MNKKNGFRLCLYSPLLFTPLAIAEPTSSIEETVVIGQKRERTVVDTPTAISVYGADYLHRFDIDRFDRLSDFAPGLIVQDQNITGNSFVIRGISSDDSAAQQAPRVSVYLNGIDVSRIRSSYFELYDIQQVEVARGPQATLFGTAAAIGSVSVVTQKPEPGFSSGFTASTGNFSAREIDGYLNGGNRLVQGRLAFFHSRRDGYVENRAGNRVPLQGYDRVAIRPSLRVTPSEQLTIDLVVNHERADDSATAFKAGRFAPPGGTTNPNTFAALGGSPFAIDHFGRELGVGREVNDINLTSSWEIDDRTKLTLVSGYREFDSQEAFDSDGTPAYFGELFEDANGDQVSHELRLNLVRGNLDIVTGINYFSEQADQEIRFSTEESVFLNCQGFLPGGVPCFTSDGNVPVLTPLVTGGLASQLPYTAGFGNGADNSSRSVFVDVSTEVAEKWEIQAGLRYVDEKRFSSYRANQPASVLTGSSFFGLIDTDGASVSATGSYNAWLPRFSVLYHGSDSLNLYGTLSKGRRSNVLDVQSALDANNNVIASTTDVPAEIIWNYEIGAKGSTFGGRLDYGLALFYQDYENFQINRRDQSARIITENAGTATNTGMELEGRLSASDNLHLHGHIAYIDATVDNDSNNGLYAGNRFRLQPKWTAALGYDYRVAVGDGLELFSNGAWTYRSSVFFEPDNQPRFGLDISEGPVALANVKVGVTVPHQKWSLYLYGQNIFDREYIIDAGNTGSLFGSPTFIPGEPATYGLGITMSLGSH